MEQFGKRVLWLNSLVELGTEQPQPIAEVWGEWLKSWKWEAWGTLTFKDDGYSHEAATRAFGRFVHWLRAEGNPLVSYFVGHEVGKFGRLHMHVLLGALAPMTSRTALWSWWFTRYGRCELRGYDPEKGAAMYVSKYVSKQLGYYDLDLMGLEECHSTDFLLKTHTTTPTIKRDRLASRAKPRGPTP